MSKKQTLYVVGNSTVMRDLADDFRERFQDIIIKDRSFTRRVELEFPKEIIHITVDEKHPNLRGFRFAKTVDLSKTVSTRKPDSPTKSEVLQKINTIGGIMNALHLKSPKEAEELYDSMISGLSIKEHYDGKKKEITAIQVGSDSIGRPVYQEAVPIGDKEFVSHCGETFSNKTCSCNGITESCSDCPKPKRAHSIPAPLINSGGCNNPQCYCTGACKKLSTGIGTTIGTPIGISLGNAQDETAETFAKNVAENIAKRVGVKTNFTTADIADALKEVERNMIASQATVSATWSHSKPPTATTAFVYGAIATAMEELAKLLESKDNKQ